MFRYLKLLTKESHHVANSIWIALEERCCASWKCITGAERMDLIEDSGFG